MDRPRPYIPLAVRVQVAMRQLDQQQPSLALKTVLTPGAANSYAKMLGDLLFALFAMQQVHLDHNPPLRARTYNPRIKDPAARYTPNANDPDYLVYRTDVDHRRKTNLRGDGAQFPDRVLIKREKRREKRATKKATKVKLPKRKMFTPAQMRAIASQGRPSAFGPKRQWPTGRKIASRPFAR